MTARIGRLMVTTLVSGWLVAGAGVVAGVGPVGSEFQVNTHTTANQYQPDVAFDGDAFVVVWQSYDGYGSQSGIFGQRFDRTGARLGSEFQINTYTVGRHETPAVSTDAAGDFVVVWQGYASYGQTLGGVFARRFEQSGAAAGDAIQVTPTRAAPAVCSSASGEFTVVWWDDGGPSARRFASDGTPLGEAFVIGGGAAEIAPFLDVACSDDGGFVVAWSGGDDGDGAGLLARQFDAAGMSVGPAFQVNAYTTGRQIQPAICTDQDGDFVIAWANELASVYARRFDRDGSVRGDDFRVHIGPPDPADISRWRPDVACDAHGAFVVVWNSGYYGKEEILARAFDETGAPSDDEFQVHTSTAYFRESPAVSAGAGGNFVVVWQDGSCCYAGRDGDGWGVLGQRFGGLALQRLIGKKLLLKDKDGKPQKRKISMISKDPNIGQDDPITDDGGSLRVYSGSAGGAFDNVYDLPASNWKQINKNNPEKGYKFKKGEPDNPIKTVIVKPGKLIKIAGKGANLGHSLAQNPNPVLLELRVGSSTYCLDFGGTQPPNFKALKKYLAKDAQPGECPPGAGLPSGASGN